MGALAAVADEAQARVEGRLPISNLLHLTFTGDAIRVRASLSCGHASAGVEQGDDASTRAGAQTSMTQLSRREREVAELVSQGLTNREIAGKLHVSVRTVEYHIQQSLNKLGLRSRTELAAWFLATGKAPGSQRTREAYRRLMAASASYP